MWKSEHLYDESALCYDLFIDGFVPQYSMMQERVTEVIIDLVEFADTAAPREVLELGTGTGNLAFSILSSFSVSRYWGYESSEHLLDVAKAKLAPFGSVVRIGAEDFRTACWPSQLDLIVSTLTFHYLPHEAKRGMFARAYVALRPGGIFIMGDRIVSKSSKIAKVYYGRMTRFWDRTTRNWTPERRVQHKTQDQSSEEPYYLEDQLKWLTESGFADVECIWKDFNYCAICGSKPELVDGGSDEGLCVGDESSTC